MYLELVEYQEILSRTRFEMDSELHDLLVAFLAAKPVRELLQHPYWTSAKDGQLGVDLDSIREAGRETEGLRDLASCAWRMLPSSSQQWLSQKGVQQVSEVAVI